MYRIFLARSWLRRSNYSSPFWLATGFIFVCCQLVSIKSTYKCFDVLLQLNHVGECAHNVKKIIEQPKNVVDIVAVLYEFFVVFPKADVVKEQRVVGQEVDDQGKV